MSASGGNRCIQSELVASFALGALPGPASLAIEAHIQSCLSCQEELASLKPAMSALDEWPREVLDPPASLWSRLAARISPEADAGLQLSHPQSIDEPTWEDVAPGICCKILATDDRGRRVSMLVRLSPGADYPPHTHAGREELHLLDGELWIDDRKLQPGDYNRAEPGTADQRVWSETGCTCVLITSIDDRLA